MQELRLVSATDDGAKLLLRSSDGSDFTLEVDERLRAAVRGDRVRMGQLEIAMDLSLRPRDIQARIRAGESAEQVAAAAKIPLDRVRRYEGPVLAEREHMASMARRTAIRGPVLSDGPAPLLGDLVTQRLRDAGYDPDLATWDSWRRDDGRWQVRVNYRLGDNASHASFVFDPARRAVAADDDNARRLLAEQRAKTAEAVVALVPRLSPYAVQEPADSAEPDQQDQPDQPNRSDRVARPAAKSGKSGTRSKPPVPAASTTPTGTTDQPAELTEPPRMGVPAMAGLIPLAPTPPRQPAGPAGPISPATPAAPAARAARTASDEATRNRVTSSGRSRRPHVPATATAPIRRSGAYDDRLINAADRSAARDGVRGKRATVPSWDEVLFGTRRPQDQ
ncbi:MAG: DUF3071 domain-containing protein [Sporichthyaceae bacterium]|nr:DUF3071 domain-containing protein [Sporichthyaceae bacterium]